MMGITTDTAENAIGEYLTYLRESAHDDEPLDEFGGASVGQADAILSDFLLFIETHNNEVTHD